MDTSMVETNRPRKYTDEEDLMIYRFLIEHPPFENLKKIWEEFIASTGSTRSVRSLKIRWNKFLLPGLFESQFESATKAELLQKLQIPINDEMFIRLNEAMEINLDANRFIANFEIRQEPPAPQPVLKRPIEDENSNNVFPKMARLEIEDEQEGEHQEEQELQLGNVGDLIYDDHESHDYHDDSQIVDEEEDVQEMKHLLVPREYAEPRQVEQHVQIEQGHDLAHHHENAVQQARMITIPLDDFKKTLNSSIHEVLEPMIEAAFEKRLVKTPRSKETSMKKFLVDFQNLLENQDEQYFGEIVNKINKRIVQKDAMIPHDEFLFISELILKLFKA